MADGTQDYWTQPRRDLSLWFDRNAPSLGELYKGALRMIYSETFPGRVRFVAHAVREIRNRLPDVIAGPKAGGPLQYKNRLDEIVEVWKSQGLPVDDSLPTQVIPQEPLTPARGVWVPGRVYKEIAELVSDHERTRETPLEAANRLFEAIDPNNQRSEATLRPRIMQWIESTEWFVKRAHDRGQTDLKMGAEELEKRFVIFESALSAMVREFFKTMEGLDEILEEANS